MAAVLLEQVVVQSLRFLTPIDALSLVLAEITHGIVLSNRTYMLCPLLHGYRSSSSDI